MSLSIAERKHQMPRGAQRQIATEHGVKEGYVSEVMGDLVRPTTEAGRKKLRRVQVALARKLGKPVDEVFPPATQTNQDTAPLQAVS